MGACGSPSAGRHVEQHLRQRRRRGSRPGATVAPAGGAGRLGPSLAPGRALGLVHHRHARAIYTEGKGWVMYIAARSARHGSAVRAKLAAFATITQDGDEEGGPAYMACRGRAGRGVARRVGPPQAYRYLHGAAVAAQVGWPRLSASSRSITARRFRAPGMAEGRACRATGRPSKVLPLAGERVVPTGAPPHGRAGVPFFLPRLGLTNGAVVDKR